MVLDKLFNKKKSSSDLDVLKERFSQVTPNQQAGTPGATATVGENASSADVVIEDKLENREKFAENELFGQNDQAQSQNPTQQAPSNQQQATAAQQPAGQPINAQVQQAPSTANQQPQETATAGQPVGQVTQQPTSSTDATNQAPASENAQQPTQSQTVQQDDLPSWAVEGSADTSSNAAQVSSKANPVTDKLEDIEDKYYDAKLNSLIIDQVKELIEIDNNLNNKIDDVGSEVKKEVQSREKLEKKIEAQNAKIKELEANMEKFLGLYEMVTNQFNPFVDTPSTDSQLAQPKPATSQQVPSTSSEVTSQETPAQQPTQVQQPSPSAPAVPEQTQQQAQPAQTVQQPVQQNLAGNSPSSVPGSPSPVLSHQGTVMPPLWDYSPLHGTIHPSMHFEVKDGQKLTSIHDLLAVLESMDDETFRHHVSLRHNDFSNWIYRILGLSDLGTQLDPIKTRPEMITVIRSYIQDKMQKK